MLCWSRKAVVECCSQLHIYSSQFLVVVDLVTYQWWWMIQEATCDFCLAFGLRSFLLVGLLVYVACPADVAEALLLAISNWTHLLKALSSADYIICSCRKCTFDKQVQEQPMAAGTSLLLAPSWVRDAAMLYPSLCCVMLSETCRNITDTRLLSTVPSIFVLWLIK